MSDDYRAALRRAVAALEQAAPQSSALAFAKDVLAKGAASKRRAGGRPKKAADEHDHQMAEAYLSGLPLIEVAKTFESSAATVRAALKRCGVSARPSGRPKGTKDNSEDPRALPFADLYRSGKTLQEIGDQHGLTRERVRQILVMSGNDPKTIERPAPPMPERYQQAIAAYLAGDSLNIAANIAGVGDNAFRNILNRAGHKVRQPKRKFNAAKVEHCAQLYSAGLPVEEIASTLGLGSAPTVYRLLAHAGVRPSRMRSV